MREETPYGSSEPLSDVLDHSREESGNLGANSMGEQCGFRWLVCVELHLMRKSHLQTSLSISAMCTKVLSRSIMLLSSVTTGYVYRK